MMYSERSICKSKRLLIHLLERDRYIDSDHIDI